MPFYKIINLNLKGKKSSFIHQEVNPLCSVTRNIFFSFFCMSMLFINETKKYSARTSDLLCK